MTPAALRSARTRAAQPASLVIRQALRSSSADLLHSPDLIVTGPRPALDTSAIADYEAYDWRFSQPPVIGAPNFVYVRAFNWTPTGTKQARVYLYWVQSDRLLDTLQWKSTGFTVGGEARNDVTLSAVSQYQVVVPASQVMWTPPVPTTAGATYYLISWLDDSAQPTPPTFPAFQTEAELVTYLTNHPQLAVLDTVRGGAFLRQYPGQGISDGGTGAQTSPDIIVQGQAAAVDASAFAAADSYGSPALHQTAALGARNFVYLRAKGTRPGARARVYLYWATSRAICPLSWQATYFTYAGVARNWVELEASALDGVLVTTVPLVWQPPLLPPDETYVLVAYVDDDPGQDPDPPDFTVFGYLDPEVVAQFVREHPQLTWLAVKGGAAAQATLSWEVPINGGTGGNFYAGVQLDLIPVDGTFCLSIPGPDAASTVVVRDAKVPDPSAFVGWRVKYPASFATSAVLTYLAGAGPTKSGARILAVLAPRSAG